MNDLETVVTRSRDDFLWYAKHLLKIRPKAGGIIPFTLNKAQAYVHERLEAQLRETGRVRAIIPKARQEGMSTYIEGRFYHKVCFNPGFRAFVLTHEAEATSNLFDMVARFHENVPEPFRPKVTADNAKELGFDTDSGYKVGTAGNKQTGRGSTIQLFHASEAAFWPNDEDIAAGALQAVPELPNTEIIIESTGNGIGNLFYNMCMDALKGDSEYELLFVPWNWMEEYTRTPPPDWRMTDEQKRYAVKYGLSNGQMYWRQLKMKELGSEAKFKQEYPIELIECFQTTDGDSFIKPEEVTDAMHNILEYVDAHAPITIGVDPARFGDDRTAIVYRAGRKFWEYETIRGQDTMEIAGRVAVIIRELNPDAVFIDEVGLGAGVYDRLREIVQDKSIVKGVNAGSRPIDAKYYNKRAEMWAEMKDWLAGDVDIVNDDEIMMDLTTPGYSYDSNGRLKLEKKEDIKKRGRKSPDIGDALALTFALPVKKKQPKFAEPMINNSRSNGRSMLL